MRELYIVSTYYHALIACVKQFHADRKADILVTKYIPQYEYLAQKIQESGLFERVYTVGEIHEYAPKNRLDYIINFHRKNAECIEKQLGVSFRGYDEIYIFHDDTWFAHYLKCAKITYNLIEDALDSFKTISKTRFNYMLHKSGIKWWVKNTFRIGYVFCGYDRFTKSVEVNCIDGVEIKRLAGKKLIENPRKHMFEELLRSELETLSSIFLREIPGFNDRNSVLLLTQPLFEDGIVISEKVQISIFKKLAEKYADGYLLVIKPHPRDRVDYCPIFPQAIVINKDMPLEIIFLVKNCSFRSAVLLDTTTVREIRADNIIIEHLENIKLTLTQP